MMLSRIRNMPRAGWFIAGVAITVLLVPSVAVAAGLKFTGIEGTSSSKANVTAAGQLLTTEVSPNNSFQSEAQNLAIQPSVTPIGVPQGGSALVVTEVHIDTIADPAPGSGDGVVVFVESGTTCPSISNQVGNYVGVVNPPTVGETDFPLEPGVEVPAGDAMCAFATDMVSADGSVSGYTVPSSEVDAAPVHRVELPKMG
jgi:hypothetical protein